MKFLAWLWGLVQAAFGLALENKSVLFKLLAAAGGVTAVSQGGMMAAGEAAQDSTNFFIAGGGVLGLVVSVYAWLKTKPIGKALLERALATVKAFVKTQLAKYPELVPVIREFVFEILPYLFGDDAAAAAKVDQHVAALGRLASDVDYGRPHPSLVEAVEAAAAPAEAAAE